MDFLRSATVALLLAGGLFAQSGHYEGILKAPDREVPLHIDIDKDAKQAWVGSAQIAPPNGPKGLMLENIKFEGETVVFRMGMGGGLDFNGKYNAEAKTISGTAVTPGGDVPFELKRTGDAQVYTPPASTAITKDLEGKWEGTLEAPQQSLRLVATFASADGKASGELISVDQNNAKIPMSGIVQNGNVVEFQTPQVGGTFKGILSDDKAELKGEWTQGKPLPLVFKKAK